jgi:hypothetical protein
MVAKTKDFIMIEQVQTNLIQKNQFIQPAQPYLIKKDGEIRAANNLTTNAGMRRMRTETPSNSLVHTINWGPTRQELIATCNQLEQITKRNWASPACGNEAKAERARKSFKIERNQLIQNYLNSIGSPAASKLLSDLAPHWGSGYGLCSILSRPTTLGTAERKAHIDMCNQLEQKARRHTAPGQGLYLGSPEYGRAIDAFFGERKELITNYLNSVGSLAASELLSQMEWERGEICAMLER